MNREVRELELSEGEAFFTVAHDTTRPFSVRVAQGRVVAVGTAFNVNALSQATEVSVTEGVVRLEVDGAVAPSRLAAGERASMASGGAVARLTDVASGHAADWRSGWLEVEAARLADVIEAINRASSRPVRLGDSALGELRVTGRYNVRRSGETLAAIARTLNLTLVQDESERRIVRHGDPDQRTDERL
jgi:transmembrane sensor